MKLFSIVVVSLNAGKKLSDTINSVLAQSFKDYEIIIKDGISKDNSTDFLINTSILKDNKNIQFIEKKDNGIYDAMNQALDYVKGKYVYFLNCGDLFYDDNVLEKVYTYIRAVDTDLPCIFYGNHYNVIQKSVVNSISKLTDFGCYRNVPCHQVCFYDKRLFERRRYDLKYKVRADYEHFLYSVYKENAITKYLPLNICIYEGNGFSESKINLQKSKQEHKLIARDYFGIRTILYRLLLFLSLSKLRQRLLRNEFFACKYNGLKEKVYNRLNKY